jgi:shikimate dehydrogenase
MTGDTPTRHCLTQHCFVAGRPISQSRSPLIHGNWIARHGIDAVYGRREAGPEDLPAIIADIASGRALGCNLTKPLKEAALPLVDRLTPDARAMGAINTLYRQDGLIWGANTDAPGYFAHLDASAPGWDADRPSVLVLGAGGACRAVLHGLLVRKVGAVRLSNRSAERAQGLSDTFVDPRLTLAAWPPARTEIASARLIINTTSLGMAGQPALDLVWPEHMTGQIVSDLVYAPLETPMLAAGRARGAHAVDGLGMLLHQAAIAFALWFGVRPVVDDALRDLVVADLTGGA